MSFRKTQYYFRNYTHLIRDWVQLPTKTEMDLWRDKNEPGWRTDFKVVTKVNASPIEEKKEWKTVLT